MTFDRRRIPRLLGTCLLWMAFAASIDSPIYAKGTLVERLYGKGVSYVPGEVIVKFKALSGNVEGSAAISEIYQRYGILADEALFRPHKKISFLKRPVSDLSRIYRLDVPADADILDLCRRLQQEPAIEYAEPNLVFPVDAVPNDTLYFRQQHLPQIHAPEAWEVSHGSPDAIFAVLDTGVDWDHPDLADNIWHNPNEVVDGADNDGNGFIDDIRGWDFVDNATQNAAVGEDADEPDNDPMDFNGHGTHVAGCAIPVTDNVTGIAGLAWNGKIMPLRCGIATKDGNGSIYMSALAQALQYAADQGAHVANISTGSTRTVAEAARYAFENGVVVSKSAGNANNEETDPLDVEPFTLTAAAVDDRNLKASYSSYGDWVKVSAPGGDQNSGRPGIFSTNFNDTYRELQGTSFSAPISGGLALLMKGYNPAWTSADIVMRIVQTADPIDALNPNYAGKLGSGVINAYRALTEEVTYKPKIKLLSYTIDDSATGNKNSILDVGETAQVLIELQNVWGDAGQVTMTLTVDDPEVQVSNGTYNFGSWFGLSNLSESIRSNRSNPISLTVDANTVPHRFIANLDISADGVAKTITLLFAISPRVLVVDDDVPGRDGHNVSVEDYYYNALDAIDVSYDVWDVDALQQDPRSDQLGKYETVIWFCEKSSPSLNGSNRAAIGNYLKNYAGKLLLFGQDIGWDLNDAGGDSNEYKRDSRSHAWYDSVLHARYLADKAFAVRVAGVDGDPIGDRLAFSFAQPNRNSVQQSPDVVDTLNGSVGCLTYPDGSPAALRSRVPLPGNKSSRLVYFPFGGIEAVDDPNTRAELLLRSINWLKGLRVVHTPVTDIETPVEQQVTVQISADEVSVPLERVDLTYTVDGVYPATVLPMSPDGQGTYRATLPAIPQGRIDYQILIKSSDGYYAPRKHYSYNVGADRQKPAITILEGLPNTFDKKGPHIVRAAVTDNLQVDSASVYLHYWTKRSPADSVRAVAGAQENSFVGQIEDDFIYGDTLIYHYSAKDMAAVPNYAIGKTDTAVIGYEDFENGLWAWRADQDSTWSIVEKEPHQGYFSLADNPSGVLKANTETTLTLQYPLDLSQASQASLTLWSKNMLRLSKDFGYVEISADGGVTWVEALKVNGLKPTWRQMSIPLGSYVGAGFDNVLLRLRVKIADGAIGSNFWGWQVDDIVLREDVQVGVEEAENKIALPTAFALEQNYPNPFNPTTTIAYELPRSAQVRIEIFNMLGQRIRTLIDRKMNAGRYSVVWKGEDDLGNPVATGMYFYRMEAADLTFVRKLLLLQ